ncbi:hypothetical protein PFISCL1PPCAC_6977 [Pristionchus fissidentatus]|uniref:Biopterin-dependent aromatic amino acid hydroxylase family profile domain-containing protein n=1 Tax=Pristionchus fissidentatus TaxID=1538716 RepID=A0AAV5V7R3_9BILA|nr:hypothetical protein PFISCL1PPCAC_6977 [Pristionchus fissidentatus]
MSALHSIAESSNALACSLVMGSLDLSASGAAASSRRRYSLVHQASFEKSHIMTLKRQNTQKKRQELESHLESNKQFQIARDLNDEGVDLIFSLEGDGQILFSVIVSSSAELADFLPSIISTLDANNVMMQHIETRPALKGRGLDVLIECAVEHKDSAVAAVAALKRAHASITGVRMYKTHQEPEVPWFPRHVSEIDKCSNCITKYEPTIDPRHPGFGDETYIARREELNKLAAGFKYGDQLFDVQYTEAEHDTWRQVVDKLETLHEKLACSTYRRNLAMLLEEGVLTRDRIPQLRSINAFLERKTGFILRPCSGLLSARDFLASLAFRVFQIFKFKTTQYLRHHAKPHHSPEPDLIHELLGHVPMFADPALAQMSQDIGLMSLGATDEQIERLATVYWFIVEFGLCREGGQLRAIGAGLLSAYGELQHACSDVPEHREFIPSETALQKYEDDDYQPLYYVADGIEEALAKLREYAGKFQRPFSLIYDPYTRSVTEVRSVNDLTPSMLRFKLELSAITTSIKILPQLEKKEDKENLLTL